MPVLRPLLSIRKNAIKRRLSRHRSSADTSPVGMSPVGPSPRLTRQVQDSWRNLHGAGGASPAPTGRRLTDNLLFEVTDASVVQDGSSKYVVSPRSQGRFTQSGP